MIEIHARDYFSLKYDAAAQNKISSLNGKDYTRELVEQQVVKKVTEVRLETGEKVSLPYGPLITSKAETGEVPAKIKTYDLLHWRSFAGSYLNPLFFYQAPHGSAQNVEDNIAGTRQFMLFGTFEATFTGLNLPPNTLPEAVLSYGTESFQLGQKALIAEDEKALIQNAFQTQGVQEIPVMTFDWSNIWLGAGLKETEDRDASITPESYPNDLDEARMAHAFRVGEYYASLGRFGTGVSEVSRLARGFSTDDLEDVLHVRAASVQTYKGNTLRLGKVVGTLLDRDTYRVQVSLPIYNASIGYATPSSTSREYVHVYEWLRDISVQLRYPQMAWEGTDFKFQVEDTEDDFPYKFQNTRMANVEDKVGDKLWSEYYPKLILDKYAEGKHYVELKVRVGFMLQNDIRVDTKLQIYDLQNKVIARRGIPCVFKVKRILRSFSNNEFYYTINCLED